MEKNITQKTEMTEELQEMEKNEGIEITGETSIDGTLSEDELSDVSGGRHIGKLRMCGEPRSKC